jgi:hypothetical protein
LKEDLQMNMNRTLIGILSLSVVLFAAPVFAQRGVLGGSVGVGGQTRVGSTAGAGAQVGNTTVGAKTSTDVQANTSTQVKTGSAPQTATSSQAAGGAAIATRIESNPQLASNVQAMLPAGISVAAASTGFRNEGQFLATLHASQNLDIPFQQLKARMTGSDSMSLGAAIKASKPSISDSEAKEAVKKAEKQAKAKVSTETSAAAGATTNTSVQK